MKKYKSKEANLLYRQTVEAFELDQHDIEILAQACDTCDRIADCEKILLKTGNFIKDRYGSIKACPALRELTQLKVVFCRQIRELKLDPGAAADVRLPRLEKRG